MTETLEGDSVALGEGHEELLGLSVHVAALDYYVDPLYRCCLHESNQEAIRYVYYEKLFGSKLREQSGMFTL